MPIANSANSSGIKGEMRAKSTGIHRGLKFGFLIAMLFMLSGCLAAASDWTRRDMPTDGLNRVVTYNLEGPAGSGKETNQANYRGVNETSPRLIQETVFDRMDGSKTQDVQVVLPDGTVYQSLGMVKTERFAGLTKYLSLEIGTFAAVDYFNKPLCGAKIRMQFNRNFVQYADPNKRDWDSLWYYDVPCNVENTQFKLDTPNAKLRAVVLNEVWQFRIASGSSFFNMGHSVTSIGGMPANIAPNWWLHWNLPDTENDTDGAVRIASQMVLDLESSEHPWLDYKAGGSLDTSGAYLIFSASDADQYATFDRLFLNRQSEYAVFYRPTREVAWEYELVKPVYNYEFNDVHQVLAGIRGLNPNDPMQDKLTPEGLPKDINDSVIKEFERIGFSNAPNASLEQIQFNDAFGNVDYAMTVRAYIGATDSLIMFGPAVPPNLSKLYSDMPEVVEMPLPVLYDDRGNPLPEEQQDYTSAQWAAWQRESTFWNYTHDNPNFVNSELQIQYRFHDNTQWAPEYCTDSDGDRYVCGYRPVIWDLSTSYYFSEGDVAKPWYIHQLLGEVGVRTLGMSYASGLYQGTGLLFAMGQVVYNEQFYKGFSPESIWILDARASQLPDSLAIAWSYLKGK